MPSVLVIVPDGFEEIELVAPVDMLRRAGCLVSLAALGGTRRVTGRNGMVFKCDRLLAASAEAEPMPDALFLPGGPGVSRLRADPVVKALVRRQHEAGKWLAAICAAPLVLQDVGVLEGLRYTAHPSVGAALPHLLGDERVVLDHHLLTGRGAGVAIEFGLAFVSALVSRAAAAEIATAIRA